MKKLGVLLVVVILTLLIIWLLRQSGPTDTGINEPNTVSFKADKPTEPQSVVISEKSEVSHKTQNQDELKNAVIADKDSKLTWLNIYRMSRELSSCKQMIEGYFLDQEYDPVQKIVDYVQLRQDENSGMPTALQVKLARNHFKQCKSLLKRVETLLAEKELNTTKENDSAAAKLLRLKEHLAQRLLDTAPITAKEQLLADVLALKISWQAAFDEVLRVSKGTDDANNPEVIALRSELESVKHRMQELIKLSSAAVDQVNSVQMANELNELGLRQHLINAEIKSLKQVNEQLRTQKINDFTVYNDELFQHLKSSDADVFFEAQTTLEHLQKIHRNYFGYMPFKNIGTGQIKAPFIEYMSPGDIIKDLTGIYDNDVFVLVIDYATQLYWCELGGDCGPQNLWVEQYCFNSHGMFNADSCGLDLRTFYQQHLLSANQWDDVQLMLSVIRELYAH